MAKSSNKLNSRRNINAPIQVGSRGSALALSQTEDLLRQLKRAYPKLSFEIKVILTRGDKLQHKPLHEIGGKGLFVKELEKALLSHQVDMVIHSLKDLPTSLPRGLELAAITKREDPHDVLIVRGRPKNRRGARAGRNQDTHPLDYLSDGATVGTSSLRRSAQLMALRPDLKTVPTRGNLDTRIRKLLDHDIDALIVAWAGVKRLIRGGRLKGDSKAINAAGPWGVQGCTAYKLHHADILCGAGQGALAVEIRSSDKSLKRILQKLNHPATEQAIIAERALLAAVKGGCQIPMGVFAKVSGRVLEIQAIISSLDGQNAVGGELAGPDRKAKKIGTHLGKILLSQGGREILNELRHKPSLKTPKELAG